jgi:fatty acid desaturase
MNADFDAEAFARDLDAVRARVRKDAGPADLTHLRKIEAWGRLCTAAGWATTWTAPNPLSAWMISQGRTARWSTVAHHVLHKGYDRVPGTPKSRTSKGFARGWRRMLDWNDWIAPDAWAFEHNQQHHYRLGEDADPDHVELNIDWLRDASWPQPVKLAVLAAFAATWKFSYYAPNTLRQLRARQGKKAAERETLEPLSTMFAKPELWRRCFGPYALSQFALYPALYLPLGPWAAFSALANNLGAEVLTNLHTFLIITTNHVGDDIHIFDGPPKDRAEFYRRQVVGSTNFRTGGDANDFLHGWLNYQIEHHLFPDLSMLQYQQIQPEIRAICERHGVPYVQESVWKRLRKTVAVMTGQADMRRAEIPSATEPDEPEAERAVA